MTAAITRTQILSLYKQFMKYSKQFNSYNFREYSIRRTREGFREHLKEADTTKIQQLYTQGLKELEVVKRQSTISGMYPRDKLVVEKFNQ